MKDRFVFVYVVNGPMIVVKNDNELMASSSRKKSNKKSM